MRCPSCDHDNRAERRFCAECGAALAGLCAACGASNEPGEKFCGGCGERLRPAAPAPGAPTPTPEPDRALQDGEGQNVRLTPLDRRLPMPDVATAATAHAQSQMVLMFTDIVDSVALKRRIGDAAYVALLEAHLALLRRAIMSESGARVVKSTGDGILARFSLPADAVRAALRIQHAMAAGSPGDFRIRLGIHAGTGTEIVDPNGQPDVAGLAVDTAARVMGLALPEQVLLTRHAFDDARQYVREHPMAGQKPDVGAAMGPLRPPENARMEWRAHGPYLFKGTDEPLDVFEVGTVGIAPLRPPPDSDKARRSVPAGEEAMYEWRPAAGQELPRRAGWTLDRKLGEGGFGEVWLARQKRTGERRVFKFCYDVDRLRSLRRELTLFRLLQEALGNRRDIARIYDVSLEHPPFFLESEYSPGGDLREWAGRLGGIGTRPLETRLDIMRRVADAVAAAHSVGILHKDLKPSNVLMDAAEDGAPRPKIADFGIGVLEDRSRLADANFTVAGFTAGQLTMNDSALSGTRMYSPPESLVQVATTDGPGRVAPFTVRGDVYALGVMLYQMVIGDFDRPLAVGWARNLESAVPDPRLRQLLRNDITEMVEGEPERRIASAVDVARRISSLAERRALLGGDERELCVMFSDIEGFTQLTDSMSPQRVVEFLNQYFDRMCGILLESQGHLANIIGDALMAIWGAPTHIPEYSLRAVTAAVRCTQSLEVWNRERAAQGESGIDVTFGLATGPMVAGNVGTEGKFAYTVMGKTVNFGSILTSQNNRYGTQILVNELCYQQCGRAVVGYHVDTVQVRGWTLGERIYTVLGLAAEVDPEYQRGAERYRAGFELYQQEQWREAISLFAEAKDLLPRPYHAPHGPAEVMAERCHSTAAQRMAILQLGSPTERWDGAWRQS